jgi:acetyltransferase-like isoleucine patch superfamily enzyme
LEDGVLLNGTEAKRKWPGLRIPHSSHIDDSAVILNPSKIKIGHHVRIDAFCVLSPNDGYIGIGNYVHIAVHCSLFGSGGIEIRNFANVAAYSILQSASDDFYGSLIGPTVPKELTNVRKGKITLEEHVILGMRTTVLPGVTVAEGTGTGAHTLLTKTTGQWAMYVGVNQILPTCRDEVAITEKASKLLYVQARFGVLKPEDFTANGFCYIHFDEPMGEYNVIIEPADISKASHGMIHSKDEYGFTIFSYVGQPKNDWLWRLC